MSPAEGASAPDVRPDPDPDPETDQEPRLEPRPGLRLRHHREHRVRHRQDFEAVYAVRVSKRFGPLQVHARPNGLPHARLGMAVPRRVGNAPRRNRIRRRIREAFRQIRAELPPLDLVVHVRAHDPLLSVTELDRILRQAAANLAGRLGVDR